jgi:hypothetical protein
MFYRVRNVLYTSLAAAILMAQPASAWCNGDTFENPNDAYYQLSAGNKAMERCLEDWKASCVDLNEPVTTQVNQIGESTCLIELMIDVYAVLDFDEVLLANQANKYMQNARNLAWKQEAIRDRRLQEIMANR